MVTGIRNRNIKAQGKMLGHLSGIMKIMAHDHTQSNFISPQKLIVLIKCQFKIYLSRQLLIAKVCHTLCNELKVEIDR